MNTSHVRSVFLAGFTVIMMLAGCVGTSPPVEFYTLYPLAKPPADMVLEADAADFGIGVGPVQVPVFLDRPQIVTRESPNRLTVNEFQRWGGSLEEDFLRTLAENLSILLNIVKVAVYPWEEHFEPDYQITLDIQRFDGQLGENVFLIVRWTIFDAVSREALIFKKSLIKEPVPEMDYEALAAAKSRAVAELSRQIAEKILVLGDKPYEKK